MEFIISGDSRNQSALVNTIISDDVELIKKLEDDDLESGRNDYEFKYLSCFKDWLSEDDSFLIDRYFEFVTQDRLSPSINNEYELPFIEFFKQKYNSGDICIMFPKGDDNYFFKPKTEEEFLTYVILGLREIQLYSFYDLSSKTYFIFLRDLTILVATHKSISIEMSAMNLNLLST